MNTKAIKRYAPKARTAFIAAMSKRAALLGIRESSGEGATEEDRRHSMMCTSATSITKASKSTSSQ